MPHLTHTCRCGKTIHWSKYAQVGDRWPCNRCGTVSLLAEVGEPGEVQSSRPFASGDPTALLDLSAERDGDTVSPDVTALGNRIAKAGSEIEGGMIVGGVLGLIGSAILGAAITAAASRVTGAMEEKRREVPDAQRLIIGLVDELERTRPFITFKYVIDHASCDRTGVLQRRDANAALQALILEGMVTRIATRGSPRLQLNRDDERVKATLQHITPSE